MSTSKRIAKRLLAVVLTVMMLMSMVTIGMASASAATVELAETGVTMTGGEVLYLTPGSYWTQDNPRYAIYVFGSGEAWASMTAVEGETNLYSVTVPAGSWTNVIFCRMNPGNTTNSWDTKWNQTADLTFDGTNNHYTVKDGTWDKGGGTWSVYTPPVPAEVPATPAAPTVAFNNTLGGTGTEADPYLVAPSVATSMVVTGVVGDATGLAYNVNYTASKVDWAAGQTSVLYTGLTAPALDETLAVNVYLWAYNATATDKAYSAEYATTTVYIKGAEATTDPDTPVVDNTYDLPYEVTDGLYAYAGTEVAGTNAWQRWHEKDSTRHFFLPATASDTEVIVLNTYSDAVLLNGVMIPAGEYATVPYVDGTTYACSGATTQSVYIAKTDAEGTLFVNSADGMVTVNDDANETETTVDGTFDLYAFLTGSTKNREAKGVAGAVASEANGINEEATIKKIKGRGNSTWSETKKPFNITYDSNIDLDGMTGKKWSLLANAKDGSLLRNRLVYDMANEIDMTYACDSRFVDFFVNGYYKGSYQLTQKIEMGKNTVMPDLTEPEVEDVVEDDGTITEYPKSDFDFILELDTEENAANANDKGFNTTEGQWMTYKTPDDPAAEQIEFIKAKYQAVEDALYGDDMAALEELVDINDFAKAYLINEVTKNIDSGVTSCYFVYSSAAGKFYCSPVWDYDNSIGNLPDNSDRTDMNGTVLDLNGPTGWYARELKHYARDARSVFSQAWYNTSTTADGKTFADIVLDVWNAEFADIVDILNGDATANGRLQSYDSYMANLTKSGNWNLKADGAYVTADWKASKTALTMYTYDATANTYTSENREYAATFAGETQYATDWTISRLNWMAAQYAEADIEVPEGYITVYFTNNWAFETQNCHYWGGSASTNWPGETMTFVETNENGEDIYCAVIPGDSTGIIFNGISDVDHTTLRQTVDITTGIVDGAGFYCVSEADGKISVGTYEYKPSEETTTVAGETTTVAGETTTVAATDAEETTTTTASVDEAETITIYFENNWVWADPTIYYWGSTTGTNPEWPGLEMTYVDTQSDGYKRYVIEVPADITGMLFAGGGEQSTDITEGWYDGICYYMTWDEATQTKPAVGYKYEPIVVETTVAATDAEETTTVAATDAEETTTTTASVDEAETITIYFENNWVWADPTIYYWGSTTGTNPEWPGVEMTYVDTQSDGYKRYVIEVPADITGIIFAGGGEQSTDITEGWYDGICYYMTWDEATQTKPCGSYTYAPIVEDTTASEAATDAEETTTVVAEDTNTVILAGSFNGWDQTAAMTGDGTTYTATYTLEAGTYEFKVIENGAWLGNSGSFENTCEGWTMKTDDQSNCTLIASGGTYTFTYDLTTHKMTVTGENLVPITCAATWDESDTYTVNAPTTVEKGTNLEFTVDAAEGYKVAAVIVDMNVLTAVDGVYTVENVTSDVTILVITAEDTVVTEPEVMEFTVTFTDKDGNVLKEEVVEYGKAATAPDAPTVDGYTFKGWSADYSFVTMDITVKAQYSKIVVPATTGKLQIEVAGGSGFTIAMNDGSARPQGTSYMNTKAPIGASVTVVANTSSGNTFVGWMNNAGAIVSTTETYTFNTTGNDYLKALYQTSVEGVNLVTFKNAKAVGGNGQILDMQYYAAGDEIVIPDAPTQAGYNFTGWSMTADEIQAELALGNDVTVTAVWEAAIVKVTITVTNGTVNGAASAQVNAFNATTVVAAAAADGEKFAYWTDANGKVVSYDAEYKFYPAADTALTANYVAADATIEYEPIVMIAADPTTAGEKITYILSWDVKEEVGTVTAAGLMVVNKNDYNADTFYHGTTDTKVFDRGLGATYIKANGTANIGKGSSYYDNTYVACTWVIYTDAATGESVTVYSDLVEVTKLG